MTVRLTLFARESLSIGVMVFFLTGFGCHSVGLYPLVEEVGPPRPFPCQLARFFKYADIKAPVRDICRVHVSEWVFPLSHPDPIHSLRLVEEQVCLCGASGYYLPKKPFAPQQFSVVGFQFTSDNPVMPPWGPEEFAQRFACQASLKKWQEGECVQAGDPFHNSGSRFRENNK